MAVLCALGACRSFEVLDPPAPAVALITLTPTAREMLVDEIQQLDVVLRDEDGNELTGRPVRWTTTSSAIATVSPIGEVMAISPGNAIIIATSEGVSGVATIAVRGPVAAVDVSAPSSTALFAGQMLQLNAQLRDVNGSLVSRLISWSSSAPAIASVSQTGVVTAVAAGVAQINASSEGKSGQITVVVSPLDGAVAKVTVKTGVQVVGVGSVLLATAELRDVADNLLTGRDVSWAMTNQAIATITPQGFVTMLAPGSVTIRATAESKVGTRQLFGLPVLFAGTPVTIAGSTSDQGFIGINIPPGAKRLTVTLRGGTGDPGLYVHEPLEGLDLPGELCGSQVWDSPIETCIIQNPVAGFWLVEIFGWANFSNVELKAEVVTASGAAMWQTNDPANTKARTPQQSLGILPVTNTRRVPR